MKREEVQSKGEGFFTGLGVKPIALNDFAEIPRLLGHLYQRVLAHDYGNRIELPKREREGTCICPLISIGTTFARAGIVP
jgi:hypothetical protein